MKKIVFFLVIFLVILSLYVLISWQNSEEKNEEIDVTDTDFEYDVAVCDRYFGLIGCIIDKDANQSWDEEMKNELKNRIKRRQEEWMQFSENELIQKCSEEYDSLKNNLKMEGVDSFGCLDGVE